MHMVTETYQLRDGEKLTEFYNGIDWESLFEFVRHYYSIGVEYSSRRILVTSVVSWAAFLLICDLTYGIIIVVILCKCSSIITCHMVEVMSTIFNIILCGVQSTENQF